MYHIITKLEFDALPYASMTETQSMQALLLPYVATKF